MIEGLDAVCGFKDELCVGVACPLRESLNRITPKLTLENATRICEGFGLKRSRKFLDKIPGDVLIGQQVTVYECTQGIKDQPASEYCGVIVFTRPIIV